MSVGALSGPIAPAPSGGGAAPSLAPTPTAAASATPIAPAATTAQSALSAMLGEAAAAQDSLAPLLANLAVAAGSPNLPQAAQATVAQLLAAQTPLDAEVTGAMLRAAAQNSGLFLEAGLAGEALSDGATGAATQTDLKALLLRLTADLAPEPDDQTATNARAAPSPDRPQPPVGAGQLAGQAAARPSLVTGAPPETMARALRQQAEAALSRVQLSQAASLPKPGEGPRWVFEAPVATPTGAGMAQFEISGDGGGSGSQAGAAPTWRARFSVNTAPNGPVHAELVLSGGRMRVTLMAEGEDARQALAADQDDLRAALATEEAGDVAVRVLGGAPTQPQPPPGQFLDRRS